MKRLISIFIVLLVVTPAMADTYNVAATSYVQGAFNALDTAKQDTLTSTNVTQSGSQNLGAVVTSVTASAGTVTVTKSDLAVPVKSGNTVTGTATIWFE